jgi:hypothetical protein
MVRRDLARGTILRKTGRSRALLLEHIVLLVKNSYTLLERRTMLVIDSHEDSITKSTTLPPRPRPQLTLFPSIEMTDC